MSTAPIVDRDPNRRDKTEPLVTVTLRLPASFVGRAHRELSRRQPRARVRIIDALRFVFERGLEVLERSDDR